MLRERAGLSVEELAEMLEVKITTIYKWEDGTNAPNIADLPKIAETLELKTIRTLFPHK
jgi:transcriptional regulator with XRE-family HTH domain